MLVIHSCKSLVGHNTPVFRRTRGYLASAIKVEAGVNPLKNLATVFPRAKNPTKKIETPASIRGTCVRCTAYRVCVRPPLP